jgi:hypothetical protein
MKINRRWLHLSVIVLVITLFTLGFGYLNSEVSFKYEVQGSITGGQTLDDHQKEIIGYMNSSKIELNVCSVLLIGILIVINAEPTFKGRIAYTSNARV